MVNGAASNGACKQRLHAATVQKRQCTPLYEPTDRHINARKSASKWLYKSELQKSIRPKIKYKHTREFSTEISSNKMFSTDDPWLTNHSAHYCKIFPFFLIWDWLITVHATAKFSFFEQRRFYLSEVTPDCWHNSHWRMSSNRQERSLEEERFLCVVPQPETLSHAPSTHTTHSDDHSKHNYFAQPLTLPLLIINAVLFVILSFVYATSSAEMHGFSIYL